MLKDIITTHLLELLLIAISAYVAAKTYATRGSSPVTKSFSAFATANMIFQVLDLCMVLNRSGTCFNGYIISNIIYVMTLIAMAGTGYHWFLYVEQAIGSRTFGTKKSMFFWSIPLMVFSVLTVLSVRTGWIFALNEEGKYRIGSLFILQYVVIFGYCLLAMIRSAVNFFVKKERRDTDRTLLVIMLIDTAAVAVQLGLMINMMNTALVITVLLSYMTVYSSELERIRSSLEQERLVKHEGEQLIAGFANEYELSFLRNLKEGSFRIIKGGGAGMEMMRNAGIEQPQQAYAERFVHPDDRAYFFSDYYSDTAVKEKLAVGESYSYEYRSNSEGGYAWHRAVLTRISEDEILLGFKNCDEEVVSRIVSEKVISDFASVFIVNIAEDTYRFVSRNSDSGFADVPGGVYSDTIREYISRVNPDYRDYWRKLLDLDTVRQLLSENSRLEYMYPLENAERRWRRVIVEKLDSENGVPTSFIMTYYTLDDTSAENLELQGRIAEQKAKLEEEQKRTDIIHEIIHSGKWSFFVNADDEIVRSYYSDEVKRVINNDLSTGAREWTDILHPDDKEATLKAFTAAVADHSCRTPYDVTYRMLDRNGEYHWFHSAGRIMRDEEGNGEFFGVHMNIDEQIRDQLAQQKQLETQNVQLEKDMKMIGGLASGYNALYYISIDENVLHIYALDETKYPGSRAIFEGEEKDFYKIIGNYGLSEQVHPDDRHLFTDFGPDWIREKLTGRKKYSMRFRAATDTGYRWDEMELIKNEGPDETANSVAVGFTDRDADIRREEEYRQQLKDAREAADAANRSKSNFLFNMSHDIRTPMNAIRGFTTMAKKNADNREKVTGYLDKIDISGQQLLTLINQVLEMARIESGRVEFEEKPVNVRKEFSSMVTVLSEQAKANGLEFIYRLGDIEHSDLLADEARMSSITLNIVGNAMKYTPEGGTVEYDLKELPARKPGYATFLFTVSDTGIGMSEEYLKELYEPFSREKNSTVSKIQGTGLGLPIVKSIIDMIGGSIEVKSEPGKGTRFDITADFRIDDKAGRTEEENDTGAPVSFEGRRVLLVEDNEMNREIARDILEEQGITVEDAEDGDIAVEMVSAAADRGEFGYYDFILMDVQMPRMNGYEATKAIRAIPGPGHIPIIAMTANAFEEDRQNALAAGMDEHLAKPIDVQKAFKTISRFLI